MLLKILQNFIVARRHDRLGNRWYRQGQFDQAIAEYRSALRLRPRMAVTHYNCGIALYKTGKKQEARAEWETVIALAKGRNPYLVEQAEIMMRQFN